VNGRTAGRKQGFFSRAFLLIQMHGVPSPIAKRVKMTKTKLAMSFLTGVATVAGVLAGPRRAEAGDQWIEACDDLSSCELATPRHVQIWAGGLTANSEVLFGPFNPTSTHHWDGHTFATANKWGEIGTVDNNGAPAPLGFDVGAANCNKWLQFKVCDQVLINYNCLFWNGQPHRAVSDQVSWAWVSCN
jgi:hypothetical protein